MRFVHSYSTPLPRDYVFEVHRDHLVHFGERLPNIERVERRAAVQLSETRSRLEHAWVGDLSAMPSVLRRFVPAELFTWSDRTEWDAAAWRGNWRLSIPALGEGAGITGVYAFDALADGTRVNVEADLHFEPGPDSPFVTSLTGRALLPALRAFVNRLFGVVMRQSSDVIESYMMELVLRDKGSEAA